MLHGSYSTLLLDHTEQVLKITVNRPEVLGEHGRRVLMECLGLQEAELADLEQRGITGQDPPED